MAKPISTNPVADLPVNWVTGQTVSPSGTDVGLSEKHGYNYFNGKVNEALTDIGIINDAVGNLDTAVTNLGTASVNASRVSGTFSGEVKANSTAAASSNGQLRNIYYGTSEPAASLGSDGDIYLEIEE